MKYRTFEPSKNKRVKRTPLRTIFELSEEFGVTMGSLRSFIGHDKYAPKPIFVNFNQNNRNTWYAHDEMRKWWKSRVIDK